MKQAIAILLASLTRDDWFAMEVMAVLFLLIAFASIVEAVEEHMRRDKAVRELAERIREYRGHLSDNPNTITVPQSMQGWDVTVVDPTGNAVPVYNLDGTLLGYHNAAVPWSKPGVVEGRDVL